jgi:hypothetical protein
MTRHGRPRRAHRLDRGRDMRRHVVSSARLGGMRKRRLWIGADHPGRRSSANGACLMIRRTWEQVCRLRQESSIAAPTEIGGFSAAIALRGACSSSMKRTSHQAVNRPASISARERPCRAGRGSGAGPRGPDKRRPRGGAGHRRRTIQGRPASRLIRRWHGKGHSSPASCVALEKGVSAVRHLGRCLQPFSRGTHRNAAPRYRRVEIADSCARRKSLSLADNY